MGDSLDHVSDGHVGDGQASVSSRRSSSGSFGDWLKSRMAPGRQDRSKRELENVIASQTMRIEGLEQQLRTAYARIHEATHSQRALQQEPNPSQDLDLPQNVVQRLFVAEREAAEILRAQTTLVTDIRSISGTWERNQAAAGVAQKDIKWIEKQLCHQAEMMRNHGLLLRRLNDEFRTSGSSLSKEAFGLPQNHMSVEQLAAEVQHSRQVIRELRKRESSLARSYNALVKRLPTEGANRTAKKSETSNDIATESSASLDPQTKENSFAELGHLMSRLDALKEHLGKGFVEPQQEESVGEERQEDMSIPAVFPQSNPELRAIKNQLEAIEQGTRDLQNRVMVDRDCMKRKFEVVVRRNEGLESQLEGMQEHLVQLDAARKEALEQFRVARRLNDSRSSLKVGSDSRSVNSATQFWQKIDSGTYRELPGLVSVAEQVQRNPEKGQIFNERNVEESLTRRVNRLNERLFSLSTDSADHKSFDPAIETTMSISLVESVKDAQHMLISLAADLTCKDYEHSSNFPEKKLWKTLNAVKYLLFVMQTRIESHPGSEGGNVGELLHDGLQRLDLAVPLQAQGAYCSVELVTSPYIHWCRKPHVLGRSTPFRDDLHLIFHRQQAKRTSFCPPPQTDDAVLVSNNVARVRSALKDAKFFRIDRDKSTELAKALRTKCETLELEIHSCWADLQQRHHQNKVMTARGEELEREYLELDAQVADSAAELHSKSNDCHELSTEVSQKKGDLEKCKLDMELRVKKIQTLTAELSSARAQLIGTQKICEQQTQECAIISSSIQETYIELNEAKHQLKLQSERCEAMREELKHAKMEHHNTQREVFQQTKTLQSRSQQVETIKIDLETLQVQLKQCSAKLESVNGEIQTITPHLQQSHKDLAEKTNELESLNSELCTAKSELTEKQNNLKAQEDVWKRTKLELQPTQEKLNAVRGLLETSTRETRLMQDELSSLQTALSEAESLLREKNSDFESHSKQVNALRPSLNDNRQKLQAMESQSQSLSTELGSMKNELHRVEEALLLGREDVETKTEELRATTDDLDKTKARLKITVDEGQHITNELCMLKADLMVTRQLLDKKEDAVRILNDELDASQENVAQLRGLLMEKTQLMQTARESLEKSQQELDETKGDVLRQDKSLKELEKNVSITAQELNVFITKKSHGGEELAQCKISLEDLNDDLIRVKTSLSQIEEDRLLVEKESVSLSEQVSERNAALMAERESQTHLIDELKKSKTALNDLVGSLTATTQSIEHLESELSSSRMEVAALAAQLEEKRRDEVSLSSAMEKEQLRLTCVKRELSAVAEDVKREKMALEEEELQLQEVRRKLAQEKQVSSLLSGQLENTSRQLAESQTTLASEEKKSTSLSEQLDQAKKALGERTKNLEEKAKLSVETERQLTQVLKEFEDVKTSLENTVLEIENCNAELIKAKTKLESAGVEQKEAQEEAEVKSTEVKKVQAKLQDTQTELSSKRLEIQRLESDIHEKSALIEETETRLKNKDTEEKNLDEEYKQVSSCLGSLKERLQIKTVEVEDATNKLTLLKADAVVTEQLLKQKEEFLARLENDLESTDFEVKKFLTILQEKTLETDRREGELALLKEKIEGLKEDAGRSKKEINEKKCASEELQAQLKPLQASLMTYQQQLEKESCFEESLTKEIERVDSEVGECQKDLSFKKTEVEGQRSQLQAKENQLKTIMETLQERQKETRTLTGSIELLHRKIEEAEGLIAVEIEGTKAARRGFESMGMRYKSCEEQLNERRNMRQGLELDVETIGKDYSYAQQALAEEVEQCERLQKELKDSSSNLAQAKEDMERRKKDASSLEAMVEKLKESLSDCCAQFEEESGRISIMKGDVDILNKKISDCSGECQRLTTERDGLELQRASMKSQLEGLNANAERLTNACREAGEEIEVLENSVSFSKKIECDKGTKMKLLTARVESLNLEIAKNKSQNEEAQTSLHKFEAQHLAAESTLKDLRKEIEAKSAEEEGIRSALLDLERESVQLEEDLKAKCLENERLEENLSNAKASINEMRAMLQTLEGKYHRLNTELKRREEERGRVEKNINEQEAVCKEQDTQLETLIEDVERMHALEAEKIQQVQLSNASLREKQMERDGVEEQLRLESGRALDLAKEVECLSWELQNMREDVETKLEVRSRLAKQVESLRKEQGADGVCKEGINHDIGGCGESSPCGLGSAIVGGVENSRGVDDRPGDTSQASTHVVLPYSMPCVDYGEAHSSVCDDVGENERQRERLVHHNRDTIEETSVIGMMSAHEIHKSGDANSRATRSPHRELSTTGMNILMEGNQELISYPQSLATSSRASLFETLGEDVRRLEQGLTDQRGASKVMEAKLACALDQISVLHAQTTPRPQNGQTQEKHSQNLTHTSRREKRDRWEPQEGQPSARSSRSNRELPNSGTQGLAPIGGVLEVMESELESKNEQIHHLKAQIAEKQNMQKSKREGPRGGERDVTSANGILQLQETLKHTIHEMDKLHDTVAMMCTTPLNSARGDGRLAPAPSPRSVATNSPRRHSGTHEMRDRKRSRVRKDRDKLPIAEEVRIEVSQNQQQILKLESKLKALVQAGALKEDVIQQLKQQLSRQSSANRRKLVWK